jgi:dTDP-4-amino-4,6-dideoxy-D-galactose acyltransferase
MSNPIACYLEWDSNFFGMRIGRVLQRRLTSATIAELEVWCRNNRIDCLYLLAEADDPDTFRLASSAGFDLIDIRLTFRRSGSLATSLPHPLVRPCLTEDLPTLREIAARAHRDTRFFADARFPPATVAQLYDLWISRDVVEGAVFVAEGAGRPVGYVTGRLRVDDGAGEIGVIAVDAPARGLGLGQGLINAVLTWFAAHGASEALAITQGRNITAQCLYQAVGFRTASVQLWYHLWPNRRYK